MNTSTNDRETVVIYYSICLAMCYDRAGKPVIDYDRKPSRDIDGNYVQPCKYWDPSIEQEYFDDIRSIVNLNKEDGRVFLWSLDIKYKIL